MRVRQCPFVHFLVLVERYSVYLHRHSRHHIRRLPVHDEGIESLYVYLLVADYISRYELASAFREIKCLHGSIFYVVELPYYRFHFFQFDAEAAYLDLSVFAAYELNRSVCTVTHYVACTINALAVPFHKRLFGLFWLVEVAYTHLRTCHNQLACRAPRHTMTVLVDHKELCAIVGIADGYVRLVLINHVTAYIHCCLRGAVAVLEDI